MTRQSGRRARGDGRGGGEAHDEGGVPLGDLARFGADVFCWCNACSHNAVVPRKTLAARLGPAIPVPRIAAHLRCSACGARDVATRPNWPSLDMPAPEAIAPPLTGPAETDRPDSPADGSDGTATRHLRPGTARRPPHSGQTDP